MQPLPSPCSLLSAPCFISRDISQSFKDVSARKYGEPPYRNAELSFLKMFAQRTCLDLETVKQQLQKSKIEFDSEDSTPPSPSAG